MVDRDLAELYGVPTKSLNQAVRRNIERFPEGFMFRLAKDEMRELVTNCDRFLSLKHAVLPSMAFTEHGVAMLSSVLRSKRAIAINIQIVQAFIQLKKLALVHSDLAAKLILLQKKVKKHDVQLLGIVNAIQQMIDGPCRLVNVKGFER